MKPTTRALLLGIVLSVAAAGAAAWFAVSWLPQVTRPAAFVGSTQSATFHRVTCRHASRIALANRQWFATPADAAACGFRPCQVCRPDALTKAAP